MFLTCCSPISSKAKSSLSRIWSRTTRLTQIPPGSASASKRAAMFTPSPKMSYSSAITSPRLMPIRVRHFRFAVDHSALDLHSAAHGVHNTRKLRQEAIASVLHNPATVLLDLRIDKLPEVCLEALVRALLVRPHQARIARHIGGEDCGETAGRGHS